jgi:hypothetical protein
MMAHGCCGCVSLQAVLPLQAVQPTGHCIINTHEGHDVDRDTSSIDTVGLMSAHLRATQYTLRGTWQVVGHHWRTHDTLKFLKKRRICRHG